MKEPEVGKKRKRKGREDRERREGIALTAWLEY